uniref:Ubiquitin-like domain-containing protein n=1 Tax=Davidia involucrata TaxID=16924 RepID=A0A5B6ZTG7_DAVIN
MADQQSTEGSGTSGVCGGSTESIVELNIKTLDSQIYTFQVDKYMPVSVFKEKIASEIGLPVGQQRLIFRGKVLKDDHLLSEYHVESGHTLHLVARQPSQSQPSPGTSSGETNANINRGQDEGSGGPRNRIGPISHSVVLGTLNLGDQGEGIVPDLTRVVGAVLNSFGIGGQATANGIGVTQPNMQSPEGIESEGLRSNVGIQNQARSQAQPGQAFLGQSMPQVLQIPLGAAIPVPSLNAPIPDSLNTLSEFMSHMEVALTQNGYQPNQSPTNGGDLPTVELPSTARGLSTPEALSIVLRHAQRLLSDHATAALSHIAGRLEQEGGSTDPTLRGQIQTVSMQVGLAMQHLGALLLELGRTMMTLRMGQSPAESYVNAGPAVYISPSGPNPIMVQPFPLQASSLFGSSAAAPANPGTVGPVGIANVPRHVNIHIHTAVGTRANNGEGIQGQRVNGTGSGDSGQTRVLPVRNVVAATIPSRPPVSVSSASQPGVPVSQPPPDSASLSSVIAEVNSRIRNFVDSMSENQAPSGQSESSASLNLSAGSDAGNEGSNQQRNMAVKGTGETSQSLPGCVPERDGQKMQPECHQPSNNEDGGGAVNSRELPSSSLFGGFHNCSNEETTPKLVDDSESALRSGQGDNPEGSTAVPLGLGLGGLQPKRRSRQPRSQGKSNDGGTSSATPSQNQQIGTSGQQMLQSLASLASGRYANTQPSGQLPPSLGQITQNVPLGRQDADGQFDAGSIMSQVLHSPALNGLLAGVSDQTGVGSPDALRNMLEQLTQSPVVRNTVNQIAQQVDSQDVGNMFSGLGSGQGGGFDLSRMVQQMMPIVSQALSSGSIVPQPTPAVGPEPQYNERRPSRNENTNDQNTQIDLQQVAQRIQHENPPREIFRSMVESAVCLYDNGSGVEDIVDELCCEEGLASEFMEMLRQDVCQRLQGETGSREMS